MLVHPFSATLKIENPSWSDLGKHEPGVWCPYATLEKMIATSTEMHFIVCQTGNNILT